MRGPGLHGGRDPAMPRLLAPARLSNRRKVTALCCLAYLPAGLWLCPVRLGVVAGQSMAPAFRDGQVFVMLSEAGRRRVARGDVVVLNAQGEVYLKRVHAVAGDTVRGLACDELGGRPAFVASSRAETERLRRAVRHSPAVGQVVEVRMPPESVFVVGDAANASYDSRHFGPVPLSAVRGRVIAVSSFTLPAGVWGRRAGAAEER